MANEILGAKKYLVLADETTWNTLPDTPAYNHIPVTDYGVRFKPQSRQANPYTGEFQRRHATNFRGMTQGNLVCPLYGWHPGSLDMSAAQYLMSWAFGNHETQDLPSKLAEWAEGPNVANKRHLGLRVNQATLAGSDDSGEIGLTLELMGGTEVGNDIVTSAQSLPANRNKLVSFEFQDALFHLGGNAINLKSFQLQIQHALKVEYLNSFTPSILMKMQRVVTLMMTPLKNSDTYDALNRLHGMNEMTGEIVLKGLHNGTGTADTSWTVATITFPRLSLQNADTAGAKDDISTQPLRFSALKPDTSSNDMAIVWTDAA